MENAILYTFSTIAQALAGTIALLAAFVLYRLQSLESGMWEDSAVAFDGSPFTHEEMAALQSLRGRREYAGFSDALDKAVEARSVRLAAQGQPEPQGPFGPGNRARLSHVREGVAVSNRVKARLWQALWPTAGAMIYSIGAIPAAHLIHCRLTASWIVLSVGIIAFVACLGFYLLLIRAALSDH